MVFRDFKDLPRRTTADVVLFEKAFDVAENKKQHGFQIGRATMVYTCFD